MNWQFIGNVQPQDLIESRLQLHYAIQLIAATGAVLAEPLPDYSHTSLAWQPDLDVFIGPAIQAARSFQVAIDPVRLTLLLLDRQHDTLASLPLRGKTLAEGFAWLQQEIAKLGRDAGTVVFLDYPPDDFPDHPIARGAAFDASPAALKDLVTYYANTHQVLQGLMANTEDATAIRIWPHHFDMATLIMLPGMKNGTPLTIGVGLSPGDSSYQEPYWYVSPYPYPDVASLPQLDGGGVWHTQHWVGAVLPTSRLAETLGSEGQQQQVETFLNSAVSGAMRLLTSEAPAQV